MDKFDERQLWIRGSIFKHMYITTAVLLCLNAFLLSNDIVWANGFSSNIIILLAVTAVGGVEMIFREVYFENSMQRRAVTAIMLTSGIISLVLGVWHLINGEKFISDGALTNTGGLLVISMFGLIIGLSAVIKLLLDKFSKRKEND